jgi:hypothetical protein
MMRRLTFVLTLLAIAVLSSMLSSPRLAGALPQCPGNGTVQSTSGSSGIGASCNDAYAALWQQEMAKVTCGCLGFGFTDNLESNPMLDHNPCSWNGSAYQVTGWFEYECATNCHNQCNEPVE